MFCKRGNVVKISSKVYKFRTLFASPQTFLYWNWTSLQMIKSQSQTTEKSKQNFVALIKRTNTTSGTKWKWNIFKHIYVLSKRGRMFIENCNGAVPFQFFRSSFELTDWLNAQRGSWRRAQDINFLSTRRCRTDVKSKYLGNQISFVSSREICCLKVKSCQLHPLGLWSASIRRWLCCIC